MKKMIAIGGLPATGKTSIMKRFLADRELEVKEPRKLVKTMYDPKYQLYILGDYSDLNEQFAGTDKLSMAVQPEAIMFLKECPGNILFEGDRLFTASFLEKAAELVDEGKLDLKILLIHTDPMILERRHIDRKDTQSEKFIKGRDTKYSNISSSFVLMDYITEMTNNNEADLVDIVNWLRLELHDTDEVVELI